MTDVQTRKGLFVRPRVFVKDFPIANQIPSFRQFNFIKIQVIYLFICMYLIGIGCRLVYAWLKLRCLNIREHAQRHHVLIRGLRRIWMGKAAGWPPRIKISANKKTIPWANLHQKGFECNRCEINHKHMSKDLCIHVKRKTRKKRAP